MRERFLDAARPHLRATGTSTWTSTPDDSLRGSDLTVTVYSYDADVAESILAGARDARQACTGFRIGDHPPPSASRCAPRPRRSWASSAGATTAR